MYVNLSDPCDIYCMINTLEDTQLLRELNIYPDNLFFLNTKKLFTYFPIVYFYLLLVFLLCALFRSRFLFYFFFFLRYVLAILIGK